MKDSLDKLANSQGSKIFVGGSPSLFFDKRFIKLIDDPANIGNDDYYVNQDSRKRLILQRIAQLSEADGPRAFLNENSATQFRPSSQDRFRLY